MELVTYAMLDPTATSPEVSKTIVEELGSETWTSQVTLCSFGYRTVGERVKTRFSIEPLDGSCSIPLEDVLVGNILTTEDERPPTNQDILGFDHLRDVVSFEELETKTVGLIISAGLAWTWYQDEMV